jgi:hypothetical protein
MRGRRARAARRRGRLSPESDRARDQRPRPFDKFVLVFTAPNGGDQQSVLEIDRWRGV